MKNVPERRDMLTEIGFRWEQVGRSIAETVKFDDNMSWQQLKWAQDIAAQGSRTQSSSGEQRPGDMRDILPGSLLPEVRRMRKQYRPDFDEGGAEGNGAWRGGPGPLHLSSPPWNILRCSIGESHTFV